MAIRDLHTRMMKRHSELFPDSAKLQWFDRNDVLVTKKVSCTMAKMSSDELKTNGYNQETLSLKFMVDDLKDSVMPLKGYKDKSCYYRGTKYSIVGEEPFNGSTGNVLKIHIQRTT